MQAGLPNRIMTLQGFFILQRTGVEPLAIRSIKAAMTTFRLIAAICLLTPLLGVAQEDLYVSFEVPNSSATYPLTINEAMIVTGYYVSKSGAIGGFVRYKDGGIATFEAPGSVSTLPVSINTAGYITGHYEVPSSVFAFFPEIPLGFIRSPNGQITTFGNPASPVSSSSFWAQPVGITAGGEIAGNYLSADLKSVAFIRSAAGALQSFVLGNADSTVVTALNANGSVIGYHSGGSQNPARGFLWYGGSTPPSPFGGYIDITFPASTGTFPSAINAYETIVGTYTASGATYDFVRSPDGVFTPLNIPGGTPGCIGGGFVPPIIYSPPPQPVMINDAGTIAGCYTNEANVIGGFVRLINGSMTMFTYPGSQLTVPSGLNNSGAMTGYYSSGSQILGFLRVAAD